MGGAGSGGDVSKAEIMDTLLLSLLFLLLHHVQAQETDITDATTIANDNSLRLQWYHWIVIVVCFSLVIFVISPVIICMVYCFKKVYLARLAQDNFGPIPPGYVLEKDLPKNVRNEVDSAQMDTFFKNIDIGEHKEIALADINITNKLGIGDFGPIFDAEVRMGTNDIQRAMIKVFQQGTSQDLVQFRDEVERLLSLEHPQVGKVLGIVSKSPYYIITELTINGDLKTFLVNSTDLEDSEGKPALPTPKLVAMASDVASGLSYLECMDYVHKDIATRNCLITKDLCVKIADFKVGRYLCRSEYAVQDDGSLMPLRWMAPESIAENTFTVMSAVWSFGVLLWEVMSRGSFPYAKLSDEEVANGVCHYKERLSRPDQCPERVYKVMVECWATDPYTRPHMSLVHKLVESSILTNKYDKSHPRLYS